jgi:nitrogen-specific signal transduction histidine kinase
MSQPGKSVREQIDEFIFDVIAADKNDVERLRQDALLLQHSIGQPHALDPTINSKLFDQLGRRSYDDWIASMFERVQEGVPKERLLQDWVKQFNELRGINDTKYHPGPWLIVLEHDRGENEHEPAINCLAISGIHPGAVKQAVLPMIDSALDDPFIKSVLLKQLAPDPPFQYAGSLSNKDYGNWFEHLIRHNDAERAVQKHYWILAQPLKSENQYGGAALFILYPAIGTLLKPELTASMASDQRVLHFFALAYQHLNFQMKSFEEMAQEQRISMIQLLAPGLINHEIGGVARNVLIGMKEHLEGLDTLYQQYDFEALKPHVASAINLAQYTQFLGDITHAFNRLEARGGQNQTVTLAEVFEQITLLLTHRLGKGVALSIDDVLKREVVHTDQSLLTILILNILSNGLNAIEEGKAQDMNKDKNCRINIIKRSASVDKNLIFWICNDGPPIADKNKSQVFKRGFTTRNVGHGQGLFFVTLASQILGGYTKLIEGSALPENMSVGFEVCIDRYLNRKKEIALELN